MRILLVETFEVGNNPLVPDWLMQPLGLMYLGAALKEAGHDEIRIFDTKLYQNPREHFLAALREFRPNVVGFRTYSSSASFVKELQEMVKMEDSAIITVEGGPRANAMPQTALKAGNLDFIVLNEGEITFPELLNCIRDGGECSDVKGIAYMKEGDVFFTEPRPLIENLDDLPFPAWDLLDHDPYKARYYDLSNNRLNYVQVRPSAMPIFTSRACPYSCIYCHKIFGKKFRAHSPGRVLQEIDILYEKYQVRQFDIYDDIFNLDRQRTEEILQGLIQLREEGRDIKLSFFNGLRGDIQSSPLIALFRKAGTFMIPYAVESASPRIQKLIRKNINLEKLRKIISFTSRMNIITVGFAMLGFPTETREELEMTVKYMLESEFDIVEFFIVTPYNGTELARMLQEKYPGLTGDDIADLHFLKAKYTLSEIPPGELEELHRDAYRRLYSSRFRISRLMSKIKYHRFH